MDRGRRVDAAADTEAVVKVELREPTETPNAEEGGSTHKMKTTIAGSTYSRTGTAAPTTCINVPAAAGKFTSIVLTKVQMLASCMP